MRSKTDEQIHHDVLKELRWDTRVEETEVGVEVDEGVVTLTGTVSSYAKKLAALEAAHRVSGVLDVADDIKVQIPAVLREPTLRLRKRYVRRSNGTCLFPINRFARRSRTAG